MFSERNPRSRTLAAEMSSTLLGGVPMSWMGQWAGGFPITFDRASGATVVDADGNEYIDFCLGDTGAMAGHAPQEAARAVDRRYRRGTTTMLPSDDAIWVGRELARRFGLPLWQFALSATDANRWALRIARQVTGRPRVLVFNYCYHGTVDETIVTLDRGLAAVRPGSVGPGCDPAITTRVVEFNDLPSLESALRTEDVACVLAEPALTNVGIVLPDEGFHEALRELTRRTGTLLVIDETHTFSAGPGGYSAAEGLEPDMITIGKGIAGGVPIGAYGVGIEIADRLLAANVDMDRGLGGTLAGNALSLAAARATLGSVLTDDAHERMIALASRFASGVRRVISDHRLPWSVTQLGARAEYRFTPDPPRNGAESAAAADGDLDDYLHLFLLNRGVLITPFHNMALMSPATTMAGVDRHTELFTEAIADLLA